MEGFLVLPCGYGRAAPALNDVTPCPGLSQELGSPSINIHYRN